MILDKKPITIAEVVDLIGDSERAEKMKLFAKEFTKMKNEKSNELKESLKALNLVKLSEEAIVNLVNFYPKDAQDIIKIVEGTSFDQEEINKILGVFE
jgi:DNA-directed RNA polymerase subunit F